MMIDGEILIMFLLHRAWLVSRVGGVTWLSRIQRLSPH